LLVGAEAPGSAPGSDLLKRVYDLADPAAPIRRHPSDFGLTYPHGDYWVQGNDGWNAHGSAQHETYLLPNVMEVASFGGPVRLGGFHGLPALAQVPVGYNRSSQAGPWEATLLWYGTPSQQMEIRRPRLRPDGYVFQPFDLLASFDHVGPFGGGDWHPMFFGDLLIYARSGGAARDGVVVYRLTYPGFDDPDPTNDQVTPHLVGTLPGGFQAYWPNLFSDGSGLYVIGSATDILMAADISQAADPSGDGSVRPGPSLTLPNFTNASYPVYQDQYAFIHNRKINLTQFLAGQGSGSVVLTLDEAGTGVDTSQMSLPLGNIWITGGYPQGTRAQGMAVWVHQSAPDTTPPRVTYHIPQAGRTDYPRHAPLSFLLHEHPRRGGPRNGIDFTVRPVAADGITLGPAVDGFLLHDFSGVLTFTPARGLAAGTTYQVDFHAEESNPLDPVGFEDAAGNRIEPYHFRFSTGGDLAAPTPPVWQTVAADTHHPAPGQSVQISASALPGSAGGPVEYRFQFGDTWSNWSVQDSTQQVYTVSGRHRVLVQARDASSQLLTQPLNLLAQAPLAGPAPTQSASVIVVEAPGGRQVWTVNPDGDTVSVHDTQTGARLAEHPVGRGPRQLARDGFGRIWVAGHQSDDLHVLRPDGSLHARLPLPHGSAPFGVVASPDGMSIYVTLYGSARLQRFSAADPHAPPVERATLPTPRALAVSGDGARVLVTRFLSPEMEGEVAEFNGLSADLAPVRVFRLASSHSADTGDRGAGVPNYLAGIAISPDGTRAAVVSKQDNVQRGAAFQVGDLTFETTTRAVISFLDLQENREIPHTRRDFDNSDSPSAVTFSPRGDLVIATLQGNNRVVGLDALQLLPLIAPTAGQSTETQPAVKVLEAATGFAPQGVAFDPASGRLYVQNFLGRSLSLYDATDLLTRNLTALPSVAEVPTSAAEPLDPVVLSGKRIFYHAADPRMSGEGYISCATCHLEGGHDGRVWDFTGRGEGFRRTPDLRGRGGLGHGNVHWSGNFDEIQDFEHDLRGPFGGTGFLPLSPTDFQSQHPDPSSVKAGLSAELDALAAYVASLGTDTVPRSPHRNPNGSLTRAALRGRDIFQAENCASCHAGPSFTTSAVAPLHATPLVDVGTLSALSGQRLGHPLPGIDTPTLLGLHATRTYLHHGRAETLGEVFQHAGGWLLPAAQAEFLGGAAITVENEDASQGGGGFLRGLLGGSLVHVTGAGGNGLRFASVDGGPGGPAQIRLRYLKQYGDSPAVLRVNGVDHPVFLLRQYPDNGWMTSGWRWLTVETTLQPGPVNTLEVRRAPGPYDDFALGSVLVAHAGTLAAAQAHHRVRSLPTDRQADLLAYLRQLDGGPGETLPEGTPEDPTVTLALAPGFRLPLRAPFADIDVTFSAPVNGLSAAAFVLDGTALPQLSHLTALGGGTHYRLRVAGFVQPGTVEILLPAGSTTQPANQASSRLSLSYDPTPPDDAAALSDEFDQASTLSEWSRNEIEEGWNAPKLEQWDIHHTTPGHMRLMPYTSSWYQDFTGAYVYKEISGDFVLTTRLQVTNRAGTGRPNSAYSLAGLMIRADRGVRQAAPQPDPGPGTVLPWPPPAPGQPGHYTTDWAPGTENYIFLSYGFGEAGIPGGGEANRWHYEVKTTLNGVSTLYPRTHGVPPDEPEATLQIVRRGSTFLLLRRHGDGPWIIENRFERPDFPVTVQIGLTTYTDWNVVAAGWNFSSPVQPYHQNRIVNVGVGQPDLIADVDYVRVRRPDPDLTQALLQAVPLTGPNGPVAPLSGSAVENWLGGNAAGPVVLPDGETYPEWLGQHLPGAALGDPALTAPEALSIDPSQPNVLHFLLGGDPVAAPALELAGSPGEAPSLRLPYHPEARGWRLFAETSTNLVAWARVAESDHGLPPTGVGVGASQAGTLSAVRVDSGENPDPADRRYYRIGAEPLP
jgi:DNA-binding beta-propeller fold protein YncE